MIGGGGKLVCPSIFILISVLNKQVELRWTRRDNFKVPLMIGGGGKER